uniref:methyltransferase family protein n=1 Tax=uncultured Erythrobacter sp. TaxID=263913 RepID=UPI00260A5EF7|nr:DUF1295 domain-containing protein [uncultured Erythrobacter sp.]
MSAETPIPAVATKSEPPESDVSAGVGLAGLLGLVGWIAFCRAFPLISETFGFSGEFSPERGVLSGPYSALAALLFVAGPMAVWSILVDKVHLRPSTGINWSLKRSIADVIPVSSVKIMGIWATYAVLAGLYGLGRWYWDGSYLFAMEVLSAAVIPIVVLAVPYIVWIDRFMINPKDASWHFGAMIFGRDEWDSEQVKKHWRAWLIKGFFGAFMISILPGGFAFVVEADPSVVFSNPVEIAGLMITVLFMIDVMIGTVGYLFTLRPLDAHIRSGNPFLGGWIAALICYPPFVWGIIGNNSQIIGYENGTAKWDYWMADSEMLLLFWGAWLVVLTAIYAWATVAFGIRFSNLTYRGVLTNGPYRYTRHPAYLSKNLYWWCLHLPFLVTSGSPAEAIRNCFFLLIVNAIYYWRARTEEAHMLAEDSKYREYYDWMEYNGIITAPLARAKRRLLGRNGERGGPAEEAAPEPAE